MQVIQTHCRVKHGWVNPQKQGRPERAQERDGSDNPWTRGVQCQRFFRSRAASGWFQVNAGENARNLIRTVPTELNLPHTDVECSHLLSAAEHLHLQAVLDREKQHNETKNRDSVYKEISLTSRTLWMDRTQWLKTYQNGGRDILQALVRLPNSGGVEADYTICEMPGGNRAPLVSSRISEQKLSYLLGAMDCLLDRCEETVRHTSRHILSWLQSTKQTMDTRRTFSLVAKPASRQRYRRLWKCFIAFLFRVSHLSEEIRKDLLGDRLEEALRGQVISFANESNCKIIQRSEFHE